MKREYTKFTKGDKSVFMDLDLQGAKDKEQAIRYAQAYAERYLNDWIKNG